MDVQGDRLNGDFGTFWLLFGQFSATMTIEQLRDAYFLGSKIKTMANRHSAGLLPERTGCVYDTRDVASWWDSNGILRGGEKNADQKKPPSSGGLFCRMRR